MMPLAPCFRRADDAVATRRATQRRSARNADYAILLFALRHCFLMMPLRRRLRFSLRLDADTFSCRAERLYA